MQMQSLSRPDVTTRTFLAIQAQLLSGDGLDLCHTIKRRSVCCRTATVINRRLYKQHDAQCTAPGRA